MGRCNCNSGSCNRCSTEPCGCKMNLSALCVVYQGSNLDTLGVVAGDRLEIILGDIDEYLAHLHSLIMDGFIGINVGGGVEIYKGLNSDDIGELRTFINSDSITVSNDTNTIKFEVKQAWIDALLNPLIEDITDLTNLVTNIQTQVGVLQGEVATLISNMSSVMTQITTINQNITNINQNIIDIHEDITEVREDITEIQDDLFHLQEQVNQNTTDITELQNQVSFIKPVRVDEFIGTQIMTLSYVQVDEIINVFYEGAALPSTGWTFQAPNQVALNLGLFGITLEPTDVVRVEYITNLV